MVIKSRILLTDLTDCTTRCSAATVPSRIYTERTNICSCKGKRLILSIPQDFRWVKRKCVSKRYILDLSQYPPATGNVSRMPDSLGREFCILGCDTMRVNRRFRVTCCLESKAALPPLPCLAYSPALKIEATC